MKETKQTKEYKAPLFQFVRQNEQNRKFFTASGGPAPTSVTTGTITSMSRNESVGWM